MMNVVRKTIRFVRRDGVAATARRALKRLQFSLGLANDPVEKRRVALSRELFGEFGGIVRYGPMQGLKLPDGLYWSSGDGAPMLLGIYEREVMEALQLISASRRTLVNLGAADGYYGVGLVKNGMFEHSYCFELMPKGRAAIKELAASNGLEKRVHVFGAADKDLSRMLVAEGVNLGDVVILCDIEGAEFEAFTTDALMALNGAIIIIEVHDFLREDGREQLRTLKDRASVWFNLTEMRMGARDLSVFPECQRFSDSDRWLMASEGRGELMTWLRLDPK